MIFLILTAALCITIFKVFNIPPINGQSLLPYRWCCLDWYTDPVDEL